MKVVNMDSSCGCKTAYIVISWLLMQQADLDLHIFQFKVGYSVFKKLCAQ